MSRKQLNDLSNEELWQLFPIILSEYQECWSQRYRAEKERLIQIFGKKNIHRMNHIGSTSVPGLLAKPTIDILVEIRDEMDTGSLVENMESAGYIYSPQPGNPPPHILFMKGYTPEGFKGQAFHVHVRHSGDWNELYFRDYLIKHPDVARKYGQLKSELKLQYEHNRDGYTSAKTDFIRRVNELARIEFPGRYKIVMDKSDRL